jgi:hypothetical protein
LKLYENEAKSTLATFRLQEVQWLKKPSETAGDAGQNRVRIDWSKSWLRNENRSLENAYFTSSRFFHRKFLLWHLRHFTAVAALRPPQSLQIFMYSRAFCAMAFLTGSNIGMTLSFFSG